ncbi:MAG: 50S ribosomal protein L22 [Chlamydiae bacterium GWC2_50_10]|uniref:Large ribosomal subunit protein uL22 n=1 Tax=uncultured Chlamydiae bacterium Rifle_16ft_4_minimus_1822 TaxID=1665093 RepID=A0A0H4T4T9_9BACT|nr:50S ribosomal protein L22, large subunit ribosomal protein L22 [uncultured Chlamydiae bacterium Rifle_16ft_4_minimus_1822]OGN52656.1 MAG: 50S ribosomal protein L22 [Chlamydiae bacterium GWA2_50_15]OGN54507.1 MAG: 50S ribosomal protein L22 [Chlamydiae bacterium GWC2_50_10]OGN57899.1 MAG: 50S ribosomal protein L22 [Chlamydiae bacterium RIFCSPHIGHO2_02_FULL_49_29]OGN63522.1 MAG: 50S ribosomal protein L22 [Chlamydiae bacterium RIFCSPHIGHO2_12_FULL_49_32]OGN68371.1 MAG: 50S ribosomal protein L22
MTQTRKAVTKHIRIPPRKARLAADLMRGLPVEEASLQMQFCRMKSGRLLKKTLDSAVANAETQLNIPRKDLIVKEVRVDAGSVLKRAKSKCRGGRVPIMKRTSHFTVIVGREEE